MLLLGMDKVTSLNNMIQLLRNKGILEGKKIRPEYVLQIPKDGNSFVLKYTVQVNDKR